MGKNQEILLLENTKGLTTTERAQEKEQNEPLYVLYNQIVTESQSSKGARKTKLHMRKHYFTNLNVLFLLTDDISYR